MRVISDYMIKKNKDEYILVPYGQAIAEHLPELRLNQMGARIYRYLQNGEQGGTLKAHVAKSQGIDASDEESMAQLSKDVDEFIRYLSSHGVVTDHATEDLGDPDRIFIIAGIPVLYYGRDEYVDEKLYDFETDQLTIGDDEASIEPLRVLISGKRPRVLATGEILVRTEELMVTSDEESFHVVYFRYQCVREMHIDKESGATLICVSGDASLEEVFFAMRTAFLLYAKRFGRYTLHSASVLYRDKAFLFSAPAGTGKSTHTALWESLFGTPVINGDLNMISMEEDGAYVHGIPWCGTSGIFDTRTYRLGGVIILERDTYDHTKMLDQTEGSRSVRLRLITPAWDEAMLYDNGCFADEVAARVPVMKLLCTKNESAAICAKEEIDKWEG